MDTKHGDSEAPNCAVNSQCSRCCCGQIQPGLSKHAEHPVTQWTQKEDTVFCFRRLSSLANLWHLIQLSAYRVSPPIFSISHANLQDGLYPSLALRKKLKLTAVQVYVVEQ